MLLSITYSGRNTTDLGYLLYKNPARAQVFELSYGRAYVYYPQVSDERTTAALLLDIDPIDLARGKAGGAGGGLFDYVNDRPYVCSSFMSTAIAKVYGTALTGRAEAHQDLADSPLDLTAVVTMLPCRGEQAMLDRVFEPLGYEVGVETFLADEQFPDWGTSQYVNLTLHASVRLRDLLRHLYVLMPVFDRQKHYWIGQDEVAKLLRHGEDWLGDHPEKAYITQRYLGRRRHLVDSAYQRLAAANAVDGEVIPDQSDQPDQPLATPPAGGPNQNTQRLDAVVAALKDCGAHAVIDLGCGEGNLLARLVKDRQFSRLTGMDVSSRALGWAADKLHLDDGSEHLLDRVSVFQGSLTYADSRLSGYDAACVVEVIEHLDPSRLAAFEQVVFGSANPPVVIVTTPNREYNAKYERLHDGGLRHSDHRFEWTRPEFQAWAARVAADYRYAVVFAEVGEVDGQYGAPTQMGVFTR